MGATFTVKEVLDTTGGTLISGRPDSTFTGITIDSRRVEGGELFVAILGKRLDGHDFVPEALMRGARGVIVQKELSGIQHEAAVILVSDTTKALGDLAHAVRGRFGGPVIAITGSSGKTTTKEMVVSILERRKQVHKTEGNLNNLIGVPLTLFGLADGQDVLVLELGTNQPGEIARLAEIVSPTIACITNIGPAHLEGLGSLEGVAREKGALFNFLGPDGTAVINRDDPFLREMGEKLACRVVTYGRMKGAKVTLEKEVKMDKTGSFFRLVVEDRSQEVVLPIPGAHNVSNALAAAAIAWAAGATMEDIVAGLEEMRAVPGRMEIVALENGVNLINDVYNANPASCEAALNTLKQMMGEGRGFVILGDMLELGEEAPERHRFIGELLTGINIEKAYLKGDLVRFIAEGAREKGWGEEKITFFGEVREVVGDISRLLKPGDWILVKGSRGMKMEEVVRALVDVLERKKGGEG
ncbi:MAG TPA: UDP-N-acetylmuramoyl-tripeptide--D-alanyl-D-alanine ligase [Syntrophales bacterium]|nr:UDP-N-acetylmuramoyl-tripeptide--D-alanyl-D-alanine ligase [Syntrophales bacterium]HOL59035.1 UDP-N-acetylmuramoyl-tripeptide--D-alanyl-D-alanine ligase [Syntrophales bacterium]HPO36287.1 UDP-N-acetylmuramoyl-tripeptide--D-alanyl-D-alanine ligase [Syntrophales bacterium]